MVVAWLKAVSLPAIVAVVAMLAAPWALRQAVDLRRALITVEIILPHLLALWAGWRLARRATAGSLAAALAGAAVPVSLALLAGAGRLSLRLFSSSTMRPVDGSLLLKLGYVVAIAAVLGWFGGRIGRRAAIRGAT